MGPVYDASMPKRNTTVTINSDLLRIARELGINLSGTLEERLAEIVAARQREQWLAENGAALEAYNDRVEREGMFAEDVRRF
jgi:antitoxin CcdA